jgi:phosphoglycerate kinase
MDLLKRIRKIQDLPIEGRRVFMRVDLDCPLTPEGNVADDWKIQVALPGIRYAIEQGARLVLASHLGRPDGRRTPELSMRGVGERLAELLGDVDVYMPEDCVGDGPRKVVMERMDGDVVLLENLGFYPEDAANDELFAQRLASLADVFVVESLGVAHLKQASVATMAKHFSEKGAGMALTKELTVLGKLLGAADAPFVAIVGGEGADEKIPLVNNLMGKAKSVLVGGAIASTFLAARGLRVGRTSVEEDRREVANNLLARAKLRGNEILLPTDVVVSVGPEGAGDIRAVSVENIPSDATIIDIGPDTAALYARKVGASKTVFWNGPMGRYGTGRAAEATEVVAKAIARSSATSVVGGVETVEAVSRLVLKPFFSHVSLGGPACIRLLSGLDLPGLDSLKEVD